MAINNLKISVVMPSLNAAATIERAIDSILCQQYSPLEFIVVDGDSSDGTLDLLSQYRSHISHLIVGKDKNVADALNKGFRLATGDIYCYLNADDALMPGAFDRIASLFFKAADTDVVTGGCLRVFADGSTRQTCPPDDVADLLALKNLVEQPSTFWRGDLHRKVGEFDDSFTLAFDWEWWNRLKAHSARYVTIPDILSVYYFSATNLTSNGGELVIAEMYRVIKQYGPLYGYAADIYRFLYYCFDLRGYYDSHWSQLPLLRKMFFSIVQIMLIAVFGRRIIYSYNWNWASKQVRGMIWYKQS